MPDLSASVRSALLAVALMALGGQGTAAAQCLSDREVHDLVNSGKVARLSQSLQRAGLPRGAEVIGAELCTSGGGYVWRVKILKSDNSFVETTIPAG